jgi:thioesterase domain-containing protein/acyl carrier protein
LNVKPIGVRDNFFELGGHSLLAIRLCEQLEKKFGKNLSPATLFQAPTIEQVASLLRQGTGVAPSWSLVVPFQTGGFKPPFFCLFSSATLALQLGPDQPVYAMQPHGLAGRRAPATVEAAAADYVKEIRALQPEGPYFLGGFSYGGLVVFEIAQQLHRQRQQIALLALLDPPLPPNRPSPSPVGPHGVPSPVDTPRVRERLAGHAGTLARLSPKEQLAYVLERIKGRLTEADAGIKRAICHSYLGLGRRLPFPLRAFYFLEASAQATRKYKPDVYPGRMVLFRAQSSAPHLPADWGTLAAGGLEVHEVSGNHFDIIREPHVRPLAAKLRDCLSHAQAVTTQKTGLSTVRRCR